MVRNVTSLNAIGSSNEIYPGLISCNEIRLNKGKVAKVIAVIVPDYFKNMDSRNLKKVLKGIVSDGNPEVVQVLITSDNFENRHLFDVKKVMEEEVKDSKISTVTVSDHFKNMSPSHLQEALIKAINDGLHHSHLT